MAWAESLRIPAQDAMAIRLTDIVLQNFGDTGIDRPTPWPRLGASYALQAHDGDRTPREILTGDLLASINVELGNPEYARAFTDCEYSGDQQWGSVWHGAAIPARPFFPLVGDENTAQLTPYAESEVRDAALQAIMERLPH